ncbi:MAG TPA: pitrilysin family protein [Bryobacteraceae bacterium]|jgi:predicted Zn-dependent peptidase|nr:pitrilysin family protein [Bryobacteraceae bacterium]
MNIRLAAIAFAIVFGSLCQSQSLVDFQKKVTEFTLANGLHFIIVERHDAPVVAFDTLANVGSVNDPGGKTGLAHMFEHMAFKGTAAIGSENWPAEKQALGQIESDYDAVQDAAAAELPELQKKLEQDIEAAEKFVVPNLYTRIIEENGGVGLNAQTSNDSTEFYYKLPSNRIELWFLMESQRFLAPVFREFYKERSVVLEERRMRTESNPQGLLIEGFSAAAFEAHPYHNPPVGWASDVEHLRVGDAITFFKTYYVPSNLSIAIVGDVDPSAARRLAEKYFGMIPAGPPPPPVHTIEPPQHGERDIRIVGQSQPMEVIGYRRPDEQSPDDAVLEVTADVLSSGRTGLIFKDLVEQKRVALEAGAEPSFPGSKYANLFLLYIVPNQGKTLADCEKPLLEVIDRLKTQKVDDVMLQRVKTKLRAELIGKLDGNAELASELNAYQVAYGDWRRLFTELDDIQKVTADDIQRAAIRYFIPDAMTVARLIPLPDESAGAAQ